MIEQIHDLNGAYELFKSFDGVGNENCIFFMVTEDPIDFKTVLKGVALSAAAISLKGFLVDHGVRNFPGYPSFSVTAKGLNAGLGENDVNFFGYLFNQTENGIGIIPLDSERPTDSIKDIRIVPNSYLFIDKKDIINVKIEQKNIHFLDPSIKIVTFELSNGQKLVFRAYSKNKYIKYHESNFSDFMNRHGFYENKKTDLIRNIAKFLFYGLLLSLLIIFVVGIVIAIKISIN